ncbi:group II intron reverse transcriptase/maturase [Xanthobacteraceae bacterium Astr-EGSB]|uniref:group II intron reverse transcriptase/maturase n=1 Tax=Astrobacterium formosum TaxID=3069710 RepID=UPI0027AF2C5C|nr:group II intron reverse transcriptase/maturase [Xanthobacteraceae bacterium Astr-EGSB]
MERVCERPNLQAALKRVRRNAGSPGIDGMTVEELPGHLRVHWLRLREELLDGRYRPQPVKRVTIPKPGGGERELGIPTVLDRFIQQALLQVLQPLFDPTFSDASYGFRPGRSAHEAVLRAQAYVQEGRSVVVDIDLEKFFDRVNHDMLMGRLAKRMADTRVLRLIRRYLEAGVLADGVVIERHEGTPQGGPLSPLLANILLDEVDKELERRGHAFVRYADDLNVYVRTQRSGERVMNSLRRVFAKLKLRVNATKSKVTRATKSKFLGFSFWVARGRTIRRRVASQAIERMKERVRELTRRSAGRSLAQMCKPLGRYLTGWKAYFRLAETPGAFADIDAWARHRLRAVQLKHWKRGKVVYRELVARGMSPDVARRVAANSRRWWHNSAMALHIALPNRLFDQLGVPRLAR